MSLWLSKLLLVFVAVAMRMQGAHSKTTFAPLVQPAGDAIILPNRYIVVLKGAEAGPAAGQEHLNLLQANKITHQAWLAVRLDEEGDKGDKKLHDYDIGGMVGYSGTFSDRMIAEIRARPEVAFVEHDQVVYAMNMGFMDKLGVDWPEVIQDLIIGRSAPKSSNWSPVQKSGLSKKDIEVQAGAPWGLCRVSHHKLPSTYGKYRYPKSAGKDVDVYIVDTGINIEHEDFEGRAVWGKTIPVFDEDIDGNGHGTHCAGIIGSKTFGIAKKANLIAVKVLRTNGFGTNSDVIKGIEYVTQQHKKMLLSKNPRKSAANMSLGGGRSMSLEAAVNNAVYSGVHFAVAAGNDNADACDYSPAAAEGPITVGASTNSDSRAFFSNHGSCVDLFAPGLDITSTWIGSKKAINTISGTSMASPHVAGVMALYLAEANYSTKDLKALLLSHASEKMLSDLPELTVNRLLSIYRLIKPGKKPAQ